MMDRFARLGLGTKAAFDIMNFDEDVQNAIEEGVQEGFEAIEQFLKKVTVDPLASAKIFGTREFLRRSARENYELDNFYLLRAAAAHLGLSTAIRAPKPYILPTCAIAKDLLTMPPPASTR